jgi:hypothetical protein
MNTPVEQPEDLRDEITEAIAWGSQLGKTAGEVSDDILRLCEAAALAALPEKKAIGIEATMDEFDKVMWGLVNRAIGNNEALATAQANIHSVFGGIK